MVKKGELIELTVESAAFEGTSVARHEGLVVFVRHAVPGDRVEARIHRKKKKHAEAVAERILRPSPDRVDPRCRYSGICGGCTWQELDYPKQLDAKRAQVGELFQHLGGFDFPEVREALASPNPFYYRNKMEFTFGNHRWLTKNEIASGKALRRDFALGLHIPRRFDRILDLEECHLQSQTSAEIVNFFRALALEHRWPPYDSREHKGYLRNLVIRRGEKSGELLVNLVTSRAEPDRMRLACQRLLEAFPQTTTFINSVNDSRSPVATGEEAVYHGEGFIHDQIGPYRFRIAATTFFQPNTLQAERLFQVALDMAGLRGDETVFDLYCGVGAISLFFSRNASRVVGFDNHPQAIRDAEENAIANGVENCSFVTMDARDVLKPGVIRETGYPSLVLLDPPRSGMHPEVCRDLLGLSVPRVVYISCNPASQARDLKILSEKFAIRAIQPVDMFPHTYHIENVVLLEAKS